MRWGLLRAAIASAATVPMIPAVASAHLVNTGLGPFYDGISHLTLTPEDLLPAIALALLAGLRGAYAGRLALFIFPASWLIGGLAGLAWPTVGTAPVPIAVGFILLGGLVATDANIKPSWVVVLAIGLGLFHGYLNGAAMSQARLGALGLGGIVAALFAVVALVAALVVALRPPWTRIAVRVAGSWIVAVGLLLLGWSLRAA
ncbi:MAG: HupE/UreJ family protein [Desulfobacterales bacterium]|nr:HupE/UreJ family protein [Desulfobacterales bacterium]